MKWNLRKQLSILLITLLLIMVAGCGTKTTESVKPQEQSKTSSQPAQDTLSQAELDFYKGKTITIIVPYSPGGSYDGKARLVGIFLEKKIPGVKAIVKNVPGAGGITGINDIYTAKPDGLTIGVISGVGMVANSVVGAAIAKYDATKINYLGRVNAERRVMIGANSSKVKDLDS